MTRSFSVAGLVIGKIRHNSSFRDTVGYIAKKPEARLVLSSMPHGEPMQMADAMQATAGRQLQQPVLHFILSPALGDDLSDRQWSDLGERYLQGMGLGPNHQWVGYVHTDATYQEAGLPRPHLHIAANAVALGGANYDSSFDYLRSQLVIRQLERDYNLIPTPSSFEGSTSPMVKVQEQLLGALDGSKTYQELVARLAAAGVEVAARGRGWRVRSLAGEWTGSQLGFPLTKVQQVLGLNQLMSEETAHPFADLVGAEDRDHDGLADSLQSLGDRAEATVARLSRTGDPTYDVAFAAALRLPGVALRSTGSLADAYQKRKLVAEHREQVGIGRAYDRDRDKLQRLATIAGAGEVRLPNRPNELLDKFHLGQLQDGLEMATQQVAASAGYDRLPEASPLRVRDRAMASEENLAGIERHLQVRVAEALTNYGAANQGQDGRSVIQTPLGTFQLDLHGDRPRIALYENRPLAAERAASGLDLDAVADLVERTGTEVEVKTADDAIASGTNSALPGAEPGTNQKLEAATGGQESTRPIPGTPLFEAYFDGEGIDPAALASSETFTNRLGDGDWYITANHLAPENQAIALNLPKSKDELQQFREVRAIVGELRQRTPQAFDPDIGRQQLRVPPAKGAAESGEDKGERIPGINFTFKPEQDGSISIQGTDPETRETNFFARVNSDGVTLPGGFSQLLPEQVEAIKAKPEQRRALQATKALTLQPTTA